MPNDEYARLGQGGGPAPPGPRKLLVNEQEDGPDYLLRMNTPSRNSMRFLGKSPNLYSNDNALTALGLTQDDFGGATVVSSIINMVCTIVGAGMLALPSAFDKTGIVIGLGALAVFMTMSIYSLTKLALVSRENGNASFRKMAKLTMPGAYTENIIELIVAINSFGLACSYLIVQADLWPQVVQSFSPDYPVDGLLQQRWFWILSIGCGLGLPLMLLKRLDSLQAVSSLGIAAVVYVVVVTILYWVHVLVPCPNDPSPAPTHGPAVAAPATPTPTTPAPTAACDAGTAQYGFPGDVIGMLEVLSLYSTAYACSMNVPTVVKELKNNTQKRLNLVLIASCGIVSAIYAVEAWAGYATFKDSVNADLLKNFPSGVVATIARIAICINVLTSFPLQMHPTKKSVSQILFNKDAEELSNVAYYAVSLFLFAAAMGVAFAVTDLGVILGYLGATTSNMAGFVLPCWFYIGHLRLTGQTKTQASAYYIAWATFIFSCLLIPLLTTAETLELVLPTPAPTPAPT